MEETAGRIKPMIILPNNAMTKEDIQVLRENGICVVECENPDAVRFLEPPPGGYEKCELAAIDLSRRLLNRRGDNLVSRTDIAGMYVDLLLAGTRMQPPEPVAQVPKAGRRKS